MDADTAAPQSSWTRWLKWGLLALGALVVAAVAVVFAIVSNHYTYCYAIFESPRDAARAESKAHAAGLEDTDPFKIQDSYGIEFTSGETGDDAQGFREEVKAIVHRGGGHLEKNTPCIERGTFD